MPKRRIFRSVTPGQYAQLKRLITPALVSGNGVAIEPDPEPLVPFANTCGPRVYVARRQRGWSATRLASEVNVLLESLSAEPPEIIPGEFMVGDLQRERAAFFGTKGRLWNGFLATDKHRAAVAPSTRPRRLSARSVIGIEQRELCVSDTLLDPLATVLGVPKHWLQDERAVWPPETGSANPDELTAALDLLEGGDGLESGEFAWLRPVLAEPAALRVIESACGALARYGDPTMKIMKTEMLQVDRLERTWRRIFGGLPEAPWFTDTWEVQLQDLDPLDDAFEQHRMWLRDAIRNDIRFRETLAERRAYANGVNDARRETLVKLSAVQRAVHETFGSKDEFEAPLEVLRLRAELERAQSEIATMHHQNISAVRALEEVNKTNKRLEKNLADFQSAVRPATPIPTRSELVRFAEQYEVLEPRGPIPASSEELTTALTQFLIELRAFLDEQLSERDALAHEREQRTLIRIETQMRKMVEQFEQIRARVRAQNAPAPQGNPSPSRPAAGSGSARTAPPKYTTAEAREIERVSGSIVASLRANTNREMTKSVIASRHTDEDKRYLAAAYQHLESNRVISIVGNTVKWACQAKCG